MPAIPLPEHASLEHLKNQAKLVRDLVHAGDAGGLDLVREFHPRFADHALDGPPDGFRLADAQLIVARLYGHRSWASLRAHVADVDDLTRPDAADSDEADDAVDRFVGLACVSYNGGHDHAGRTDAARAIAAAIPDIARRSIATAAVVGDCDHLAALIDDDPATIDRPCGPHRWPPLLYCCYSRIAPDGRATLAAAQFLLDAGADPNAGFLWRGLVPPFTALTGAFGRGETDQPPHPARLDLARALLIAGADPNDGQTLYDNGLAGTAVDDPSHLRLLHEFGLGTPRGGPWYERFGDRLMPPRELLHDELEVAAHRGLPERMRFLVGLDLDLERPVGRSQWTPWRLATEAGHDEVLAILTEAGVRPDTGP